MKFNYIDSFEKTWFWERLRAGGEGDNRGWDDWMASLTQWTWVWVDSSSWWWTGRPGVLRFMGSQRVGHDWVIELNWTQFLIAMALYNEVTLLFTPWLFFQHLIRKCMPFNLRGFGEPVYYAFHSFSNCRRQEVVAGLPDSTTGWKGLGKEWTVLKRPTEPWLTSWLCSFGQNTSLHVEPNGQCQE